MNTQNNIYLIFILKDEQLHYEGKIWRFLKKVQKKFPTHVGKIPKLKK